MVSSSESTDKAETLLRWTSHGLLVGGFLLMMIDIRFEHRQVVGEIQIAWLPIFYSMAMLVLIPLGVALWKNVGRYILAVCYVGAIIVGMLGIYFHSDGHLIARLQEVVSVWQAWVTKIDPNGPFYPPILAPFAFLGLGSIGLYFTFRDQLAVLINRK